MGFFGCEDGRFALKSRLSELRSEIMQFNLLEEPPKYYASLQELIDEMMQMNDDPLADAGTNVVICRGNPEAKLMLIGEAPGPQENIKGKPLSAVQGSCLTKFWRQPSLILSKMSSSAILFFGCRQAKAGPIFVSRRMRRLPTTNPICWKLFGWLTPKLCC
jgi:DNA polymerase